MEKAIALKGQKPPRNFGTLIRKYSCFYIGSEFCQNLLPETGFIGKLAEAGAKKIVIATSFMTDARLEEAKKRISSILKIFPGAEISLSDFGLLSYLNRRHPRTVKNISRPLSMEWIRMERTKLEKLVRKLGISAIETDEANLARNFSGPRAFRIHFHYPFRLKGIQRDCFYSGEISDRCRRPCLGKSRRLKAPGTDAGIYALENGYFTKEKPDRLPPGADRLIFHPMP